MIKVDIISGFLGAGKTTLISKLIKEQFKSEKVVLIENEFGEIGIDGGFLKEAGVIINEMNSGCICCSLVGDFEESLQQVVDTYKPERIIIEPSGVGKLSDIIAAVKTIDGIKINTYSTIVDATKAKLYAKNFKEFFNDQIEAASCVILSKTQNASEEKLKEAVEIIKGINAKARVVTTSWDSLSANDLLNVMEGSINLFKEDSNETCGCGHHHHNEECGCGHHHEDDESCDCHNHHEHDDNCSCKHDHDESCSCNHHHEHNEDCECGHHHEHHHNHVHADEYFTSLGYETINKYTSEELNQILSNLDDDIVRAKGIVQDNNGKWLFFDYVPGEVDIREGNPAYTGLITVIGTKSMDVEKIKKAFGVN